VRLTDDARCSRPVQASISVPVTTALGLDDEPGWLEGHGWVSAPLSRRLLTVAELRKACVAATSGRLVDLADRVERPPVGPEGARAALRRMVLQPHDLRDVVVHSQPQHDPSPALVAFVAARDRWCDGPTGAAVPARRSDKDHERSWPTGPTAAWNLVSRSPRTHQLKHAGWSPARGPTGTTWTSPAGQVVHVPTHDRPPEPPLPGAVAPDPELLTARDAVQTLVPEWPAAWDVEGDEDGGPDPERTPDRPGEDGPTSDSGTLHGWSDEPPF
jgi:hypothetical protein